MEGEWSGVGGGRSGEEKKQWGGMRGQVAIKGARAGADVRSQCMSHPNRATSESSSECGNGFVRLCSCVIVGATSPLRLSASFRFVSPSLCVCCRLSFTSLTSDDYGQRRIASHLPVHAHECHSSGSDAVNEERSESVRCAALRCKAHALHSSRRSAGQPDSERTHR